MPYQTLDSAVLLAIGIWLLALVVFGMMVIVVCAKLIAENRSQDELPATRRPPAKVQEDTRPKKAKRFFRL